MTTLKNNTIAKTKFLALTALVTAMAGCSTLPSAPKTVLAQPNINLNQNYPIESSDKETKSTITSASIAEKRWQDFYNDDKLKSLIALGLANNKSMERAIIAIQKAHAQYQITNANSVPGVNASAGYNIGATERVDRNHSESYSVGLASSSYELDLWGRVASLKDAALQSYLSTAAAKDTTQITLIANIAQGYVALSYAKAQLMLAESTVASRERSLYITQKRFEAGIDSKSPSLQAEASLESAKLAVLNAKTSLLQAQNALELLIGGEIPSELMPEAAVTGIISDKVFNAGLPSDLLYYRPDIAQAEHSLKAAGANIDAARAAYFPKIALSGSLGLGSSDLDNLFKSGAMTWSFGPSISIPIFDGGLLNANYETAQLNQRDALAAYEYSIQTAFKEVKDVLATRATLGEQIAAQYRLQENYQRTYDIAYATFRSGLSNYLNVLDAERSLFANQQSILSLEQQRVNSQINLYKVLGGGANLSAPQLVSNAKQKQAMTSAKLATDEQIKDLQPVYGKPATFVPADNNNTNGTSTQITDDTNTPKPPVLTTKP